ncbi:hypothetical protein VAWG004_25850 [Aeromonas veronii]|nr:hypothetical protein VAWG004_25850 [Aeromonas veronii]
MVTTEGGRKTGGSNERGRGQKAARESIKREADIAVGLFGVYLNGMSGARSILFSPTA